MKVDNRKPPDPVSVHASFQFLYHLPHRNTTMEPE